MRSRLAPHRKLHPDYLLWLNLISALIFWPLSSDCRAQVVDPVTAAQLPIPGAGHQYIGSGTETVNPVDGSVSFNLPIQTPAGRQLSFPFGIRYNGTEPFFLGNGGSGPQFGWQTPAVDETTPFDVNGWSYALPNYVAQAFVSSSTPSFPLGSPNNYCWADQNYSFRGFDGIPRTLYVTNNWADGNNPTPEQPSNNSPCTVNTYENGGDEGLATSFGTATTNIQPALTVTDKSGTVYQFPQGPGISTNPTVVGGGITPFGVLAQTITDKNGNQIALTGSGNVGSTLGPGSYKDTLGRTVVSWSGLGSTNGDQLMVSGLGGNIVVKWTTTTVTFPQAPANSKFLYGTGTNCGFGTPQSLTIPVVSEIDLPNLQKYSFTYGGTWGMLQQITFPDGGHVRYTWGTNPASQLTYQTWIPGPNQSEYCYAVVDTPAITDRYVSFDGVSETLHQQFQYLLTDIVTSNNSPPYWDIKKTSVTSTDSTTNPATKTVTTYSYVPTVMVVGPNFNSWQTLEIPVESQVVYQDGSNNTLRTINETWRNRFFKIGNQTILDNGQGVTTLQCPDRINDNVLATYEYDFQSNGPKPADPPCSALGQSFSTGLTTTAIGPLLRQTVTAYHSFAGTNILNEPDSVTVSDPSNPQDKLTKYFYDAGTTNPSNATTGLVAAPGLRGNPTSVQQWLNTTNTYLTTSYTYYDTGQINTATDPCGNASCPDNPGASHTTTYGYADQYATGTGAPPSVQTNAYLTQVTYPNTGAVHQESNTWGYADGLIRSHTDQNSQTSNYMYNDPLVRLKQVQGPPDPNNGGQSPITNYTYNDWTPSAPTASNIQSSEVENTSGAAITSTTTLSGMGQVLNTQATSDPAGTDWVDTAYDGFGRVASVSNPHRPSAPLVATQGITTYGYDAINRKISQTDSDGTSKQMWLPAGNTIKYTDESGNQWLRTTDALGRLIQVLEPGLTSQTPTLETDYTYNTLDDLMTVTQHGTTGEAPVARSFTYDSLSRLMTATNAESGTTMYAYDFNGNLQSKTDARGAATGGIYYCYDGLNRVTSKSYSSSTCPITTPDVAYVYDTSSITGNQLTVGRLTSESTFMNGTLWTNRQPYSYNPTGRVLAEQQCTPGNCAGTPYRLQYTYDLAGNVTSSTNGVANPGVLLTYNYDCSSRLGTVTSTWEGDPMHPATLFTAEATGTGCPSSASSPYYTPANQLEKAQLAFNATTNLPTLMLARTYDSRLRPTSETDTEPSAMPPGAAATLAVTISGAERSVGGSGNATQATGTIAFSDPGGAVVKPSPSGLRLRPLFVGSSITLPDGYHASFVAAGNNALSTANALASVLNAAASPVTAVVVSGGTATAASVTLTAKVPGSSENGSIKLSLVATHVRAAPATLAGGGGASYDTGTVMATVNSTSLTTSYGQASTSLTVAQALASAINAAALGVAATAAGSGTLTVTASQVGTAGNAITVTLASSTSQPGLFTGPSFTGTSGTLAGGTDGPTGNGTIYSYTIPAPGVTNGYDPRGNLLSYTDCVTGTTGCATGTWAFNYDNLSRISTGLASAGQWNTLSLGWTYDSFGNRKTQSVGGNPQAGVPQSQSLNYPSANHIMGYTYDPSGDGDLLYDNINQYVYDAEGRVCAVSSFNGMATTYLQYVYDAEGRRVGKGSINTLACTTNPMANGFALSSSDILGLSGEQVSELDGSGNFLRTNVYAAGRLLATYANGSTQFAFGDWLGTKRVAANPDGTVAETCASLPFGDELICSGADPSAHHFTGQLHDQETHNDYFSARYYSNNTGRFLSPDWSSTPAAIPFADLADPQSLNLYAYVKNNPLNRTDPLGHNWFDVNGQWSWHEGDKWKDGTNTYTSKYTGLLVAQQTGTDKKTGATTYSLTLYDQNKAVATGNGFSGGNGMAPIKDGNYMIHLDIRDPNGPNTINPNSALGNPPAFFGIQKMHDFDDDKYHYNVVGAYGPIRARLNPMNGGKDDGDYFHGQSNGHGYTHGCLCYGTDTRFANYMWNNMSGSLPTAVDTPVQKP